MMSLYNALRSSIEEYFEKKIEKSSYHGLQELYDMVDDCVYDVEEIVDKYDKRVDGFIEDLEEKRGYIDE